MEKNILHSLFYTIIVLRKPRRVLTRSWHWNKVTV